MFAKVTLSALAIALAAPAFAATQLERSAGVDAGVYTQAQIGEIASAEKPNDAARLKAFYLDNGDSTVSRADFSASAPSDLRSVRGSDR
ncbi:MAG: hypothetical protein WBB85_15220 [Albidovulum sp.]|uniref:hypothetical protein n=1 Tax=Albidovulum sp. TaxID=1872424 RepID=UPI003CA6D0FE